MGVNRPLNIIVHHSAVSYDRNPSQFTAMKRYHINKGWGDISYHYVIEKNGEVKIGREENQSGAHTYQKMMNYLSLGICLTGNFDEEEPTIEQCKALYKLLNDLTFKYSIPKGKVVPHRHYATYKSCWGKKLPDDIYGYLKLRLEAEKKGREVSSWAVESAAKANNIKAWKDQKNPDEPALTMKGTYYMKNLGILSKIPKDKDGKDRPANIEELNHGLYKRGLLKIYE